MSRGGDPAVRAVQAFAASVLNKPIVIDGLYGTKTESLLEGLSKDQLSNANAIYQAISGRTLISLRQRVEGVEVADGGSVFSSHKRALTMNDKSVISPSELRLLVTKYAKIAGMQDYIDAIVAFADREAPKAYEKGVFVGYSTVAKNGSSRGLFQIQPNAWVDAARNMPGLGPYDPFNVEKNVAACVGYAAFNIKQIKPFTPITGDTLYLAHNQGAGFFTKGKVTAFDKQSREVQSLILKYKK